MKAWHQNGATVERRSALEQYSPMSGLSDLMGSESGGRVYYIMHLTALFLFLETYTNSNSNKLVNIT
jgi:hypothetical protein